MDKIDDYKIYREMVMDNIEYDRLAEAHGTDAINGVVGIMLSAICGSREYIRIGGRDFPADVVKRQIAEAQPFAYQVCLGVHGKHHSKNKEYQGIYAHGAVQCTRHNRCLLYGACKS